MTTNRRSRRAAALFLTGLAALAAGTGALAQETSNTVVGPPVLKDFELPGRRTTPPATTPPPVATTPAPATPTPAPPDATAPRRDPAPDRTAPAREPARTATPRAADATAPAPAPAETAPEATPPAQAAPVPIPTYPPPEAAAPVAEAAPMPAPVGSGPGWLPIALGGGALLAALVAFFLFRRRRATEGPHDTAREELGENLFAAPAAAPEPEPEPEAPPEPRPWLELDIKPERAAATDAEAAVHYELYVRNKGDAPARNIRIDARLFNASAEGDIAGFFNGPMHEMSGSPHIAIAPGGTLRLTGQVTMPKAEVREIELRGVRIFVPMVAINAAYDWEGGSGRTSKSWLVGREAPEPAEKMGAFRLDLGPRIYRSVGRREGRLVMV